MDGIALTLIFLLVLFTLLGSSVWIGISLLAVAWVGMELFTTRLVGDSMALTIWSASSSWTLTALPLFVWMGEILFRTRLSENLFRGLQPWLHGLPGGLLHVNITGSAIFAAICGSSAATVLTVGKMAVPELKRRKYPEKMIIGTLAGAGTLGLLIPPSIILIIYGVTVNESIVKLFIAGVIPGIMLALMFMGYVAIWDLLGGRKDRTDTASYTMSDRLRALGQLAPIMGLILSIMGSIAFGYATATEAAVLGVLGAFAISWQQGHLTRESFIASLMGATRVSCMIAFILAGSTFLTLAMGFTGLPRAVAEWIAALQLTPAMLIAVLAVFYIILGCFLDGISSIVLTMAVVEPIARQAGFDMIWFGVFLTIVVEIAQITPPIGFNLFVLQGMTGRDMDFIARAALPMFALMVLAVVIISLFPGIATWLPSLM
ncbi:TRAP transporter large permease subunit [Anderseniella sp. Alg231-50]|uniref:TRAP transporter large permease subunit n=1 Tax=Anderseniella sp. Alg231-50 TaxID=1922226 RepID=UPI000D554B13